MTVQTQTKKVTANGNDVATSFSFSPLVIFESSDLVVTFVSTTGVETVLSEGSGTSNYSVVVSSYPGTGSITYPASGTDYLATGEKLIIKRVLTLEQQTDLENQGGYFPEVQEEQLDKLVMIDLQQQEEIDRSLKLPVSVTFSAETDTPEALQVLRCNSGEDGLEWVTLASTEAALSDASPSAVSLTAAAAGTSADISRADHTHLLPTVSVAKGGTGATSAADARTNLGLVIGTDVQSYDANTAKTNVAQSFTKGQGTTPQVLTDGATITPDASLQNNQYVVLGGNRTLGIPSNMTAGKTMAFRVNVYQDSTGSRTLAYAWCYKFAGGSAPTLTTTALARDKLCGDINYYATSTVTITIAAPGVVTWTAHGLKTGDQLQLTTTGALPTGLSASTTYFVIKNDADSFWLASSRANAAAGTKIATSGSQSGTHTAVACEIDLAIAKAFA